MEAKLLLATNPRANIPLSSAPFAEVFVVQTPEVVGDQFIGKGNFQSGSPHPHRTTTCSALPGMEDHKEACYSVQP